MREFSVVSPVYFGRAYCQNTENQKGQLKMPHNVIVAHQRAHNVMVPVKFVRMQVFCKEHKHCPPHVSVTCGIALIANGVLHRKWKTPVEVPTLRL
jgi:hypothetical protein